MIYLDNAATSWPKPESVYQAMDKFQREQGGNPGHGSHSLARAALLVVEETRRLAARLIQAPEARRVIFTFNCTDALNLGLKGLLRPGDHVLTSMIGHNSFARPLHKLAQQGVNITRLPPAPATGSIAAHALEQAIRKETKLVAVTHASNVTGQIQPIAEYGRVTRKHGVLLMVDAAQTAGKHPLDVAAENIDLLAFSGHKGTFGPQGTGVLYVGERVTLDTLREGGTGTQSELEEQPLTLPERYESGTVNGVGICGLGAGLKYLWQEGVAKIAAHEWDLTERLSAGLVRIPGVILYAPPARAPRMPVVSFNLKGYEPGEVGVILDQAFDIKARTGLHCAPAAHKTLGTYPSGTIRLSPGYFNTPAEIDSTLQAIAKIAQSGK